MDIYVPSQVLFQFSVELYQAAELKSQELLGIFHIEHMEEEKVSAISNALGSNKRARLDMVTSSTRFKGVVLQQNGHWGAQIYANHQRVWLGTFKSEKDAAMAYDSAALMLRNGEVHRNFPWTCINAHEPAFQNMYPKEEVLSLIRNGSYQSRFMEFIKSSTDCHIDGGLARVRRVSILRRKLFQKELTPSDVGKLNRLVIPKKYAIKFFPPFSCSTTRDCFQRDDGGKVEDVELVFFDREMRSWRFRFCYWKSSQSYVFTRGWNRFAKEKQLKSKDTVVFYKCEDRGVHVEEGKTFCMIDIEHTTNEINTYIVENLDEYGAKKPGNRKDEVNQVIEVPGVVVEENGGVEVEKKVWLFGVMIN